MPKTKEPVEEVAVGDFDPTKKPKIVEWLKHPGSRIRNADVDSIGKEFEMLTKRDGHVTAKSVLVHAKSTESVMHSYITWNNKAAANKQRITEAGYLMRNIKARCIYPVINKAKVTEKKEFVVRYLHPVTNNDESKMKVYKSLDQIIVNEDHKRTVTYDMYRYLMGAFNKFNGFAEVLDDLQQLEPVLLSIAKRLEIPPKEVKQQIQSVITL
jgi:uncharacterized protein YbaA (DUF1428 family)